jgi:hypothetical protein
MTLSISSRSAPTAISTRTFKDGVGCRVQFSMSTIKARGGFVTVDVFTTLLENGPIAHEWRGNALLLHSGTLDEPAKCGIGRFEQFGMPLHGQDLSVGGFESLDHAVGSKGAGYQAFAESLHGLMMK